MIKHLLSINDVSVEDANSIFHTASSLASLTTGEARILPTLRGRTIVNLFFEDSTRTRLSFEAAAKRLSANVINFSAKGSSVSKGESLKDTVQTLEAMGADAFIIRHHSSGAPARIVDAGWVNSSIISAGDGTHEHPTQALLDAFTITQHFPQISDLKIAIVGDILHSRVARSNVSLLSKLGAKVTVIAPPTLLPVGIDSWPCKRSYSFDDELDTYDVVMMLRVQLERMKDAFFPNAGEYSAHYGLGAERLKRLQGHAIIMHPGPMNRGLEISAAGADSPQSVVLEQVRNGVIVRMAVLYQLLGGPTLETIGKDEAK